MTNDEMREMADRALEIAGKATVGPWEWRSHDNRLWTYDTLNAPTGPIVIPDWQSVSEIETASGMDVNDHDAALIAASRTIVPDLANALKEALDEIDRLRAELASCAAGPWRTIEEAPTDGESYLLGRLDRHHEKPRITVMWCARGGTAWFDFRGEIAPTHFAELRAPK